MPALQVDGGAAANDLLMQFQADLLQAPIERPADVETTALGAALLAGLGTGMWAGMKELREAWRPGKRFKPKMKTRSPRGPPRALARRGRPSLAGRGFAPAAAVRALPGTRSGPDGRDRQPAPANLRVRRLDLQLKRRAGAHDPEREPRRGKHRLDDVRAASQPRQVEHRPHVAEPRHSGGGAEYRQRRRA